MSAVLTLPRLGETMEEGRIVAWLVAPGTAYKRGDALLEVETDKTVVEVPALEDGTLAEILEPEGAQVSVGAPLARLAGEAREDDAPEGDELAADPDASPDLPARKDAVKDTMDSVEAVRDASKTSGLRATPLARRLARNAGLDLKDIPGTGRRGRVEEADVARHIAGRAAGERTEDTSGITYALAGPEAGRPVLLLHGFAGDHTLWSGLTSGLARAGCRVLAPDLPGHGTTARDAAHPDDLATGVVGLIQETVAGPMHVVAHSLAAVPAVALAEAGLARSLTLIAPVGLGLKIDATFIRGLAASHSAGEVAHLLQRMTVAPLALSQAALAEIAETLSKGRLQALADALVGPTGQSICLRAPLARLAESLPVRIAAPHRDRILDWHDMTTVSPRIAVHHLPRAGHMAIWDASQEVLEIVQAATEG